MSCNQWGESIVSINVWLILLLECTYVIRMIYVINCITTSLRIVKVVSISCKVSYTKISQSAQGTRFTIFQLLSNIVSINAVLPVKIPTYMNNEYLDFKFVGHFVRPYDYTSYEIMKGLKVPEDFGIATTTSSSKKSIFDPTLSTF